MLKVNSALSSNAFLCLYIIVCSFGTKHLILSIKQNKICNFIVNPFVSVFLPFFILFRELAASNLNSLAISEGNLRIF